jgi:uncharacterized protein YdeI (YjbR/CyaY-like superfamily)
MDDDTKKRLRPILENSKRGRTNTRSDDAFAQKCWRKWPEEYTALHAEVVSAVTRSMNPFA